ncbi:hypothetical protein CRG98_008796 [Punica granatum]|uniref:Uncharacterized protein n=1 Tax=Punica granatum TaxID=22663 RepID=A0A2I0KQS1_PUNGR|nr:hypothetical protein CRG98_008796 [Punica granatum]
MASYHLVDDLGKCPVYEVGCMREQNSLEDKQDESVAGVSLIRLSGPIDGKISKQWQVSYDESEKCAINKAKCSPKAHDDRCWSEDDIEPKTGMHPGTTKVREQASDDLPELDLVSRGTFQWSRTSPGEPSERAHGKQRSQRSLSTTTTPEHLKTFREH